MGEGSLIQDSFLKILSKGSYVPMKAPFKGSVKGYSKGFCC